MKLYFQQSDGHRRFLKICTTETEAVKEIHKFCEERNFKIYYTRVWKADNGEVWRDVGSHSEFFIITDIDCVEEDEENDSN